MLKVIPSTPSTASGKVVTPPGVSMPLFVDATAEMGRSAAPNVSAIIKRTMRRQPIRVIQCSAMFPAFCATFLLMFE